VLCHDLIESLSLDNINLVLLEIWQNHAIHQFCRFVRTTSTGLSKSYPPHVQLELRGVENIYVNVLFLAEPDELTTSTNAEYSKQHD